jgi:hypothetical protein
MHQAHSEASRDQPGPSLSSNENARCEQQPLEDEINESFIYLLENEGVLLQDVINCRLVPASTKYCYSALSS